MDVSNTEQTKTVNTLRVEKAESDKIQNQNNVLLDEVHKLLKKSTDENNKIKFDGVDSPSFYLPTFFSLSAHFGFPSTHKHLFDLIETFYDTPINISNSSKYELSKKGVGFPTVSKIVTWCKLLPLSFLPFSNHRFMGKLRLSLKVGSNAGEWLSFVHGVEASCKQGGDTNNHLLMPLLEFLEERCKTEVNLFHECRKKMEAGDLNPSNTSEALRALYPLWRNNPFMPDYLIDKLDQMGLVIDQQKAPTERQTLSCIEVYCYMRFDFYLEVITQYEVGFKLIYCVGDKTKLQNDLGIITDAITAYVTDDNIKTCFSGMLRELQNEVSELVGEELGSRKLASFIDMEDAQAGDYGETLADKQYKQLKDWRNGLNLPSDKKLISFLQNLDDYAGTSSDPFTFMMCRITMGVDKLINEILDRTKTENCHQADVEKVIKKVLSSMPEYYKANLKKQLDKSKPTG